MSTTTSLIPNSKSQVLPSLNSLSISHILSQSPAGPDGSNESKGLNESTAVGEIKLIRSPDIDDDSLTEKITLPELNLSHSKSDHLTSSVKTREPPTDNVKDTNISPEATNDSKCVTINRPDHSTATQDLGKPAPKFNQSTMTKKFRMRKQPLRQVNTVILDRGSNPRLSNIRVPSQDSNAAVSIPDIDSNGSSKNSCGRCKRLKKKCNKSIPECSNCSRSGDVCIYMPRKSRKKSGETSPNQTIEIPVAVSTTTSGYISPVEAEAAPTNNTPFNMSYKEYQQSIPTPLIPPLSENVLQRSPQTILSSKLNISPASSHSSPAVHQSGTSTTNQTVLTQSSVNFSREQLLNKPFSESFVTISAINLKLSSSFNSSNSLLQKEIQFGSKIDKSLALNFIKAFFNFNYHREYPFINEKLFMTNFNGLDYENLNSYSRQLKFEIYLIMAIGCKSVERSHIDSNVRSSTSTDNSSMDDKHFPKGKVKSSLGNILAHKALGYMNYNIMGKGMDYIRCLLLLGVYLLYFEDSDESLWELTGRLVREALFIGLNRTIVKDDLGESDEDIEMRRRVFWSVHNLDRIISFSIGKPVGIKDEDVGVPLPKCMKGENKSDVDIMKVFIQQRKLEGKLLSKIYSANNDIFSSDVKEKVISDLRIDIENWYAFARDEHCSMLTNKIFSFQNNQHHHGSFSWYSANYYYYLTLLYMPSNLEPNPSQKSLELLWKSCLQSISLTYNLFTSNLLPLSWPSLHRVLNVCKIFLKSLSIKIWTSIFDTKNEIYYCSEILEAFGNQNDDFNNWISVKKCSSILKETDRKVTEIISQNLNSNKIGPSHNNNELKTVHSSLLKMFSEASSSYNEVLHSCSLDTWNIDQ